MFRQLFAYYRTSSYPRIADRKGVYELFGPVNKLYCARYDRAMVAFLACLRVRPD